ncbi:MAG: sodium:proton antiporter, partial [Ketobacteraceae bacterium]|nr:sodium:proton antiporter [Ketobacteraceae bacterium]
MSENVVLTLAMIGVCGLACQWLAWRWRLPSILFLLLTGITLGPVTGVLSPDDLFGDLLFPLVSLGVAVILFEGSLTLKLQEIRGTQEVVWRLVTFGVLISWVVVAAFTHFVLDFSWQYATLFGALVVVTGPTVIVPMLRTIRPNAQITSILRWEGILIDPIGALLAVLVFDFIVASSTGGNEWLVVVGVFTKMLLVGLSIGFGGGYAVGKLLGSPKMPKYLHNFFVLIAVFAAFAIANALAEESGLLAVTLMGIWMANRSDVPIDRILNFKESLSLLLISGLFILLGARLELNELISLGWPALMILLVIQFVAQPAKVFFSAIGSNLNWREKLMISWIGPRGIIAAAVSALFALRLQQLGFEDTSVLVSLTFAVIIGTVVLQSLTAKPLAKALGVSEGESRGLLIVGANPVARAVGKELKANDFNVLLVDSHWPHVSEARMAGLPVFHGNPVSQIADQRLDLVGYGYMLGLHSNDDLNVLSAQRYVTEFGNKNTYTLRKTVSKKNPEKHQASELMRGRSLFGENVSYSKLASLLAQGAEMKTTVLRDEFNLDDYLSVYEERAIP